MSPLTNDDIATVLNRYADLIELAGEGPFRVRAYRRAAERIRTLSEPVRLLHRDGRLRQVQGIGAGIAAAVGELLETGHYAPLKEIEQVIPPTLPALLRIPGVGAKTAGRLYRELGIADVDALEAAAVSGQLRQLSGFGPAAETKVLAGLAALGRRTGRTRLGAALPIARRLTTQIATLAPLVLQTEIAGSIRRMEETIADIDIVVATNNVDLALNAVVEAAGGTQFERHPDAVRVKLESGLHADIFVAHPESFGSALIRATGPDKHLTALAASIPKGRTESEVYAALAVPWIPPELRQGGDEIARARAGEFADLIELNDVRGEFHSHTTWSDGSSSIKEMAAAAKNRGYEFLAISDHTHGLGIANGLDPERLERQCHEIRDVNRTADIRLFTSAEVEVARDGRLDFDDATLARLDVVIASTHVGLQQPREQLTARLLAVIENPHVDIIAHPSGRLIEQREGGDFDWDRIFETAARTGTALEINADPARLDLGGELAQRALDAGCLLTVNCDAHHPEAFALLEFGIGTARRTGASRDRVINCWPLDQTEAWLHARGTA